VGERLTRTTRRLAVGELQFRVLSSGPDAAGAPGPAYVIVHGIGTSHRYSARLHDELAAHSLVHSLDLPGFGGLPKPRFAPSVVQMAAALAEVLDRLEVSGAVLIGHSMGAQWVVEVAAQRPELARGVVAIGPVADDAHRSVAAQSLALAVDVLGEPPDVNVLVFGDYLRCGPSWFLREVRPMVAYPIEDRVAGLPMPFLVIRGADDPIAGTAWCRRLRDRAACGGLAVVSGSRHVVQHTAPRAVASAVRSLESIVASRAASLAARTALA